MTRSRLLAIALGLLGGVLVLAAASRTWITHRVAGLPDAAATHVTGSSAAPSVPALALVALAAAVVLGTAGRAGRLFAAALLVVAGLGIPLAVLGARGDGSSDGGADVGGSLSAWAWVAAAGGAPLLVAGGLAFVLAGRWPAPTRRYERAGAGGSAEPAPTTAGSAEPAAGTDRSTGGPTEGSTDAATDGAADRSAPESDAWASLSRGEDPTR